MGKLLREDDSPLQVLPELASWIGLNEAILIQQLHYWSTKNGQGKADDDGAKWIRATLQDWRCQFPFWDDGVIRRTLENLEGDGLMFSRKFTGRTKWYRVNYQTIDTLSGPIERLTAKSKKRKKAIKNRAALVKNEPNDCTNCTDGNCTLCTDTTVQSVQSDCTKCTERSVQSVQLHRKTTSKTTNGNQANADANASPVKELPKPKTILMNEFISITGLVMPTRKTDVSFWWSNIGEIYNIAGKDTDVGKKLIYDAVAKLHEAKLTVSGPNSLVRTCRAIAATDNKKKRRFSAK